MELVNRLALGVVLIACAAGVLLFSDRTNGRAAGGERVYKIGLAYFAPEEGADICIRGLLDGLRDQGFVEGRNLQVLRAHAQAEISNIPAMLQNFDAQDLDLIVPLTTPCLAASCSMVRKKPVVFSYVYDPLAAGAGRTRQDHLAHITGVGSFPPLADTFATIRRVLPGVRALGTLYNSSEANSRKVIAEARTLTRQAGWRLEEVTVTSTSEVFQAAQVLSSRNVDALWVTGDNTALQAFSAIVKASRAAHLPLFINDPEFTAQGALVAVGIGWHRSGYAAGLMAARVLRGEKPRYIPFEDVAVRKLVLNQDAARALHITFPPALVAEADK
jgi:putative tryptophan/tyrosine transport system substrate-binding protein